MNTREVVLVGAGAVAGYLFVAYLKKSKDSAQDTAESVIDQAKFDKCNQAVDLLLQTAKFANPQALEAFKKQAFEECMAKTV